MNESNIPTIPTPIKIDIQGMTIIFVRIDQVEISK